MNLIYGILIGMILMYIFINKSKNEIKIEQQSRFIVKKLLRQTARWATAAKQV